MKPIANFENVKEAGGMFENLPAGGYVCEIKQCKEKKNKNGNGTHLEILFDISDDACNGEYSGWFEKEYRGQDREEKFWHGIINQNCPDEHSEKYADHLRFFKSFINAVEDSNPGYHWAWNEETLKGKRIGVVFGEVERESKRGTKYFVTNADRIVKVSAIKNGKFTIPEPKRLATSTNTFSNGSSVAGGAVDIPPDYDLPFD